MAACLWARGAVLCHALHRLPCPSSCHVVSWRTMTLVRRIGSQAAIYGLGYGFSRILGFALLPLYTRNLSAAEYGVLSILTVTSQVAAILSQVGMGAAMFREVIYQETDRRTVESTAVLFLAGMSALVLLITWILSPWLSQALWETGEYTWLLQLTFLGAAFSFLESVFLARLRIEMRSVLYTTLAVARFLVSVGLTVLFLIVLKRGLLGLVESTAIVAALFGVVYLAILWRNLSFTFSFPVLRRLMRFGAPLLPANAASTVTASSDRYFV